MYNPTPIKTNDVVLSDDILSLVEVLAQNTHDIWATGRIKEGWTYGESRDDKNKKHPCLVPYDELPDSEKEYDRATAMETLKVITKLGYEVKRK